jgi:hypothetical protein
MSAINDFFDEHYKWKAAKEKHKEKSLTLRAKAQKEFHATNWKWFKTLDALAILILVMNLIALVITGVMVVQAEPSREFVEGNPAQCQWNGYSCHIDGWDAILPILRQMFLWAILIGAYIFTRKNTFTMFGLWVLTALIILYVVVTGYDALHDVGLYLGRVIYGTVVT